MPYPAVQNHRHRRHPTGGGRRQGRHFPNGDNDDAAFYGNDDESALPVGGETWAKGCPVRVGNIWITLFTLIELRAEISKISYKMRPTPKKIMK